jgi:two-component system sensor histidine kinase KdpD
MDWYSIEEVIQSVVQRLEPDLTDHHLAVDIEEGLPLTLLDFSEIDQVITNLIDNALKYTPPASHLKLSARSRGSALEVTVADDGPGVPPEHLPRLFDKFYQVDSKRSGHGAGLGLAISKGLIEAHGGRITARNRPGGGLEIAFTLPIVSQQAIHPVTPRNVGPEAIPAVK